MSTLKKGVTSFFVISILTRGNSGRHPVSDLSDRTTGSVHRGSSGVVSTLSRDWRDLPRSRRWPRGTLDDTLFPTSRVVSLSRLKVRHSIPVGEDPGTRSWRLDSGVCSSQPCLGVPLKVQVTVLFIVVRKGGSVIIHAKKDLENRLPKPPSEFRFSPTSFGGTPWSGKDPNLNPRSAV